jgi:hypothetical protein
LKKLVVNWSQRSDSLDFAWEEILSIIEELDDEDEEF